jgi:hypothetical protein
MLRATALREPFVLNSLHFSPSSFDQILACVLSFPFLALLDLRQQPLWVKSEFVDKLTFAKEFLLDIEPDADVLNDVNCRGLVMSTF